jgi:hypothetical protein
MITLNAIKKLEKATGKKVTIDRNRISLDYNNKYDINFIDQQGKAILFHLSNKKDPSNVMTDYSSDIFFDNISKLLKYLTN